MSFGHTSDPSGGKKICNFLDQIEFNLQEIYNMDLTLWDHNFV